jgi:hypothetical protein
VAGIPLVRLDPPQEGLQHGAAEPCAVALQLDGNHDKYLHPPLLLPAPDFPH